MEILKLSLLVLFHPIEGFNYIKIKRDKFTYFSSIILILLVILVRVAYIYLMHYPIATLLPRYANIWLEIIRMCLPLLTWVLANYAINTISEGKTLMREVLMATALSMLPYIILTIPLALFSHVLSLKELKFFDFFARIIWIWVGLLLFISTQTMNEYSFGKTVGICLISIVGILLVWVIAGLVFTLSSQVFHFIEDIILEIKILLSM